MIEPRTANLQVKPRIPYSSPTGEPKAETWLVLDATPSAYIYAGLRTGVDGKQFADRVLAGEEIVSLLRRIKVNAGDVVHVPAGQVHALGAGCLVLEIQQSSETTYRIFDWNRDQQKGLRRLHVHEALASIDYEDAGNPLVGSLEDGIKWITPWYRLRCLVVDESMQLQEDQECAFVMPINGMLRIDGHLIKRGSFALLSPLAPNATCSTPNTVVVTLAL